MTLMLDCRENGPASHRTPAQERGLAVLFYLGLAPAFWLSKSRNRTPFLTHHFGQAMAIWFMFFVLLMVFVASVVVVSMLMVHFRGFYDQYNPEKPLMSIVRKLFLCWLVFWVYGVALAAWGSERELPVAGWLARKPRCLLSALLAFVVLYAAILGTVPLAMHAASLARADTAPGKAYMLYEDIDRFPRWMFTLGFYPIARAATQRWGPGSVVALKLSRDAIRRALQEGHFVFIGSHGRATGLLIEDGYVTPEEVKAMGAGASLQFVYLTGCDSGAQREAWEQAFAPAKVVTYDRLTAVIEHGWWLLFKGPDVIRSLD
jgi:hypothetical protein